jgi:orotate phosphoribosyltransferase
MSIHSNYLENIFSNNKVFRKTIREIVKSLKQLNFDYLIGTGLSGSCVIPTVALRLNKLFAIVRKDLKHHGYFEIEGLPREDKQLSYLILDDFISTGATVDRIFTKMQDSIVRKSDLCIGLFSYKDYYFGFTRYTDLVSQFSILEKYKC